MNTSINPNNISPNRELHHNPIVQEKKHAAYWIRERISDQLPEARWEITDNEFKVVATYFSLERALEDLEQLEAGKTKYAVFRANKGIKLNYSEPK